MSKLIDLEREARTQEALRAIDEVGESSKSKSGAQAKLEELFSPSKENQYLEIPRELENTVIGRYAKELSTVSEIPYGTVFSLMLGMASAAVAMDYCTAYEGGDRIAAGLYVTAQQPPSVRKSMIINAGTDALQKAIRTHNADIIERNEMLGEDDPKFRTTMAPLTDVTGAALDSKLNASDAGRAVIVTAEKGGFASLFPKTGTFHTHNDLMLKGWQSEYSSAGRISRHAYVGCPQMTFVVFAQPGSINRVLTESDRSGLAERFIFVDEPSNLGRRKLPRQRGVFQHKYKFDVAAQTCVENYSKRITVNDQHMPVYNNEVDDLKVIVPTESGRDLIYETRLKVEELLGEAADNGDGTLSEWVAKVETHILKIATTIHVFDCLAENGFVVSEEIPLDTVAGTIEYFDNLIGHMRRLIHDAGESGQTAEATAVLEYMDHKPGATVADMSRALRKNTPFRSQKNSYQKAKAAITHLVNDGILKLDDRGRAWKNV